MPKVMCRYCKQYFDRSITKEGEYWVQPANKQYYHSKCWDIKQKVLADAEAAAREEENVNYKDLAYDYLKKIVRISVNWNKFDGQWRNLIEKKGRRPKGIYLTLRYCYDIVNLNPEKAEGGIGIVDYKYTEAEEYWRKRMVEQPEITQKLFDQYNKLKEENKVQIERKGPKQRGPQVSLDNLFEE